MNKQFSSSSSQSTAYVTAAGAGGSSSSSATSPAGNVSSQEADFVAGATSANASASASASASEQGTTASVSVPAESRNLFWGGSGADIFQLASTGASNLDQADIILDYDSVSGDQLVLAHGLSPTDLAFEIIDLDNNGVADSTVIRSLIDNTFLGIVVNTVDKNTADETIDEKYQTRLSATHFINLGTVTLENALVSNTETLSEEVSLTSETPGSENQTAFLIGTANDDILIGGNSRNVMTGYAGADTFALSAIDPTAVQTAPETVDILVDFSSAQGDQIQLPEAIDFSDITLEVMDINHDGALDSTAIKDASTGGIYAVVLGTVQILGTFDMSGTPDRVSTTTLLPGDFGASSAYPTAVG
ncbi:MAG: hypothetical protein AAF921_10145 [Cyanobacteria bacterium P01_D01_bin.44]